MTGRTTGPWSGVAESPLQRIYDPFERGVNEAGTGFGLGLAIASRSVEMHGGTIWASNQPCGGLNVEIFLPCNA